MRVICFVPVGEGEWDVLEPVMVAVAEALGRPCRLGKSLPHPAHAYNRRRDQYLASAILNALRQVEEPGAERLLGVADLDLYAPGLNFVFGQATMGGREAVIALPRLRQRFYGLADDPALFQARVVKEAIHELGHTYGLGHCQDVHCVMSFSNSLRDVDRKEHLFCPACRRKLP